MNKENYTYDLIKRNNRFSVSILSEDTPAKVINKLGFVSGKDHDKWDEFKYEEWNDLPIVKEHAMGHMLCEVQTMVETSTHYVFLAKVVDTLKDDGKKAMTYEYYHNVIKGKAPKKAPTYQSEEKVASANTVSKEIWVCSICGYVYEGDNFEAESDDYVCPICYQPKEVFEKKIIEEEIKMEEKKWVCSVCQYEYDGENFENESEDYVCPICGVPKLMFEEK